MPALVEPFLPAGVLCARPQPHLTGPDLDLRPWGEQDVPTLITAYSDPDVQLWHCRSLDADEAVSLVLGWHRPRQLTSTRAGLHVGPGC